jgi:hypothetical protein
MPLLVITYYSAGDNHVDDDAFVGVNNAVECVLWSSYDCTWFSGHDKQAI